MVQMNVFLGYFIKFYLVFIWFYHLYDMKWVIEQMVGEYGMIWGAKVQSER